MSIGNKLLGFLSNNYMTTNWALVQEDKQRDSGDEEIIEGNIFCESTKNSKT